MKIAYVKWRDAGHGDELVEQEDDGLVDLQEVGFLLEDRTDSERVTLCMEMQEGEPGRKWLTIPRVNVLEFRTTELGRAFKLKKS